jgi:plastocyanin
VRLGPARLFLLLFAVTFVVAACSSSSPSSSGTSTPPPSPTESESESGGDTITIGSDTANDHGSKDVSSADDVSVEMDDFYFEPTVITGTPGQQLTVELENEGTNSHNFSIDDQQINKTVAADAKAEVSVTFPDSGFVEFYCSFHRSRGMAGELTTG